MVSSTSSRRAVLLATPIVFALTLSILNISLSSDRSFQANDRSLSVERPIYLRNTIVGTIVGREKDNNAWSLNAPGSRKETLGDDGLLIQEGDSIYTKGEWDMAPIVIEEFKLIFFTSAKVGCTTWKQLFRRIMGYSDWRVENVNYLPWNPARNGLKYLYHYDRAMASAMLTDPSWTRAIFVRDPKERFLSAYLDKAVRHPYYLQEQCCRIGVDRGEDEEQRRFDEHCVHEQLPAAKASLAGFLEFNCDNSHWRPQSRRMEKKYWETINYVGHMQTVAQDAERLLRQIGAWEQYGASGWGEEGNSPVFQSTMGRSHATSAATRLQSYLTPELEHKLDEYYKDDYEHPVLNLTWKQYASSYVMGEQWDLER